MRVNKHGAQISKIKQYALDRSPVAGVRTLGRENMVDFGECRQADFAELVETERLQQRKVVVFQDQAKEMSARMAYILNNTADKGEEEPAHWEN